VLYESVNTFYTCQLYGDGDTQGEAEAARLPSGSLGPYRSPYDATSSSSSPALGTYTKLLGDEIDKALSGPLATVERYIDDFTTGWKVVVVAGGACPDRFEHRLLVLPPILHQRLRVHHALLGEPRSPSWSPFTCTSRPVSSVPIKSTRT
jgi:hypothetical protein